MTDLPKSPAPYTDKYFLRSKEVLQKEGLNPFIRAQLFIRDEEFVELKYVAKHA